VPRQLVLAGFSADQDEPDARSPRIHLFGSPTDRMARHDGGVRAGGALLAEARSKSRARLVRKISASIVRKLTMPTVPDGTPSGAADEDDFDRRLRELTEGGGPEVRFWEPSAAERARRGVQPRGRRASRKARKLREPLPEPGRPPVPKRRAGKGQAGKGQAGKGQARRARARWPDESPGVALRRHRSALALIILVALVVAGVTVAGWVSRRHLGGSGATTATSAPAVPSPSRSPASPSLSPSASVADPFLGTPAASFADDQAGIVPPGAHAVGAFSAAQVRTAYGKTRQLLIAAGLNQATLRGGRPVVFAGLLTAQERKTFLTGLNKTGLDRHGFSRSTRGWVASFAPGEAALTGPVIKVRGHMRGRPAVVSGRPVLQVHADYLFVYPVTQPGLPATLTRIVFRFVVNVDFARWDDPGGRLKPFWELVGGGTAGARCGINDGFIHPDFRPSAPQPVEPSGAPVNPYDQQIPPDSQPGCQATTGT
jgi:hypothetical protein